MDLTRAISSLFQMVGLHVSYPFAWTGFHKMAVFFTDEEVKGLDAEFVAKLDMARKFAGVPFVITSGLRTCAANAKVLGVENSAHLTGKAVDLAVEDSVQRFRMVSGAVLAGFTRIGVYDRHLHLDCDDTKPQHVLWLGVSH
jgi:uncharacterized protein YcbK (DUF882 family)